MTSTENKDLVVRMIEKVWNEGESGLLPEIATGEVREEAGTSRETLTTAFPDLRVEIEDLIAEADRVVARLTFRGTHQGPFHGIPATGRAVEFGAIRIYRVENGLLAETWANQDAMGLMRQLTGK